MLVLRELQLNRCKNQTGCFKKTSRDSSDNIKINKKFPFHVKDNIANVFVT